MKKVNVLRRISVSLYITTIITAKKKVFSCVCEGVCSNSYTEVFLYILQKKTHFGCYFSVSLDNLCQSGVYDFALFFPLRFTLH